MPASAAVAVEDQEVGPRALAATPAGRQSAALPITADLTRAARYAARPAVIGIGEKVDASRGTASEAFGTLAHAVHAGLVDAASLATTTTVVNVGRKNRTFAATASIVVARNTLHPTTSTIPHGIGRGALSVLTTLLVGTRSVAKPTVVRVRLQVDAGTAGAHVGITTGEPCRTYVVTGSATRLETQAGTDAMAAVFVGQAVVIAGPTVIPVQGGVVTDPVAIRERGRTDAVASRSEEHHV